MKIDHLFRWDLDKTYLKTEFESLKSLVKTFFQTPSEKENIPASDLLIKALRRDSNGTAAIYFLSGSPKQMRKVLQAKLRMDGVYCEDFQLKDNLRNVLTARFRAVKDQLGFKLPALLESRTKISPSTTETLIGDDAEQDAFIYSLYADLLTGSITAEELDRILTQSRVFPDVRLRIYDALDHFDPIEPVERIIIHLTHRTSPQKFSIYGPRLVPVYNYLQASVVLMTDGRLSPEGVNEIARFFSGQLEYDSRHYIRLLRDMVRRRLLCKQNLEMLLDVTRDHKDKVFNDSLEMIREKIPASTEFRRRNQSDWQVPYSTLL